MPKLKKTERKKRWWDPEGSLSGGTGVLRASSSAEGDGLGGMRPGGEEEAGGSSEASGSRLRGATDFGLTGGPYAQVPHRPEAGTTGEASEFEEVDVRSGRERPAQVSGS